MGTVLNQFISIDPQICHGRPRFRGTRIPVATILAFLEHGTSVPEILLGYPSLSKKAVLAAIRYARQRIESEEFIPIA